MALSIAVLSPDTELDRSTTVNSDRIRQQLNWSPIYSSYQEGLDRTISVWQRQGVIDRK